MGYNMKGFGGFGNSPLRQDKKLSEKEKKRVEQIKTHIDAHNEGELEYYDGPDKGISLDSLRKEIVQIYTPK